MIKLQTPATPITFISFCGIILILLPAIVFSQSKPKKPCEYKLSYKELIDTFTSVERDSIGYLIYKPCDGSTPSIVMNSRQEIIIFHRLEDLDTLNVKRIDSSAANEFSLIASRPYSENKNFLIKVKLVDCKQKLILWTIGVDTVTSGSFQQGDGNWNKEGCERWVTTPIKFAEYFRIVTNPCPVDMKPEKKFLPIEFK